MVEEESRQANIPFVVDIAPFNITVLGRFNQHIVEPGWATKFGVIAEPGWEARIQVGGGSPFYRLPQSGLSWTVLPDRLVVFGSESAAPVFVSALLTALPHTPMTAVGVNFCTAVGQFDIPNARALSLKDAMSNDPLGASESRMYQLDDGVKLTVKVDWDRSRCSVTTNFHLDASDYEKVIEHANRTSEFRDLTAEVLKKLSC